MRETQQNYNNVKENFKLMTESKVKLAKKKGVCKCRECGTLFHKSEVNHTYVSLTGEKRIDAVCPCCGSKTWGLVDSVYVRSDTFMYQACHNNVGKSGIYM